jgi:hypothetical protein
MSRLKPGPISEAKARALRGKGNDFQRQRQRLSEASAVTFRGERNDFQRHAMTFRGKSSGGDGEKIQIGVGSNFSEDFACRREGIIRG